MCISRAPPYLSRNKRAGFRRQKHVPCERCELVCNNFKRLGREGPKLLFWKPVDPGPVALAQRPSVDVRVPACPPFERRVLEYRVVAPPRSHLIW